MHISVYCCHLSLLLYFQTGLIIVDSPGVGDTPEMTQLVLDYVMEASAFVFIINTIDGVQTSRVRGINYNVTLFQT